MIRANLYYLICITLFIFLWRCDCFMMIRQVEATNHCLFSTPNQLIDNSQSTSASDKIIHGGFNHCGIIVSDNEKSKKFFMEVFDFVDETEEKRPKTLPFPGSFLRFGNHQVHLMQLPNPDPVTNRPEYGGRDRHMALWINNVDIIRLRLEKRGIAYNLSKSGRRSLFCRDYDGNAFEFVEDLSLNQTT